MTKPTTAPARLDLLIPWLNGTLDEHHFEGHNPEPVAVWTDYAAIRRALEAFVKSFDGSAAAAYVVAEPDDDVSTLDDDAIGDLEAELTILLEQGFGEQSDDLSLPLASLRVAVRGVGRQRPGRRNSVAGSRVVAGGVKALRDYRAPGAYVLRIQGSMRHLIPFLVATLLTAPDMVAVRRCQRPGCPHFVVTATAARGAPRKFCSRSCGALNAELNRRQPRRKR